MPRLRSAATLAAVLALLGVVDVRPGEAICPSKGRPQAPPAPPPLPPPFDPPAPAPVITPPDEPEDVAPPPPPAVSLPDPAPSAPPPPLTPPDAPPAGPPAVTPPGQEPPPDAAPPAAPPAPAPTTPPAPPPVTTPTPRTVPAPDVGARRGRQAGERALDALDDASWEAWWALNRATVLPRVQRQVDPDPGSGAGYARTLPVELRPALDALLAGLDDDEPAVAQAAAAAFTALRTSYRAGDTLAALRRAWGSHDLWLRDLAGLALARRGDVSVLGDLLGVLRNRREHDVSRGFAAVGLIALGEPSGLAAVAEAAADLSAPEVAGCALVALGQTRDLRHLPVLLQAAQRRTGAAARLRRVRCDALVALGKLGAPAVVPYLACLLDDREKTIARAAALALGGFPGDRGAVEALRLRGLAAEDPFVRAFGALSLGRLGDPSALPALAARLEDDEPAVRPFALLGLGLLRSRVAAPLLHGALTEQPRTGTNAAAALAAGLVPAPVWTDLLVPGAQDARTFSVPAGNALGLGLLGARESAPALRRSFWLDGVRARPGFAQALALLEPDAQARWLSASLARARRSGERQVLVGALALCAGPAEAGALVRLWETAPRGDAPLRARVLAALAAVVNDREVSLAQGLLCHTYYLQPNLVLAHLAALP